MPTMTVEDLKCPKCPDHEPFGSKAALGAHMSIMHGLRLDGTPAEPRKKPAGRPRKSYEATVDVGGHTVLVHLNRDALERLMGNEVIELLT